MAGRVQLETSGPQDAFFTDDPEYTYFIKNFQKHIIVDLFGMIKILELNGKSKIRFYLKKIKI